MGTTAWRLHTRTLELGDGVLILGIVNVTPDSFSDGGAHSNTAAAVDHALRLLDEGADVLDIGGESTRPGSAAGTAGALSAAAEQARVLPVIDGVLRQRPEAAISIDTYCASTAHLAVQAGAQIVNDVSGLLWDSDMAHTIAELHCGLVLMHTRGVPSTWQTQSPLAAGEVLPAVLQGLTERLRAAQEAGIAPERIVVDPGFGFGKRPAENWALLQDLAQLRQLGRPLLVGLSRKGFLDPALAPQERDTASHAAGLTAVRHGAQMLRVHDVAGARAALQTYAAVNH